MGGSYESVINLHPGKTGNMYYRGDWEYNPEYDTGDVVLRQGLLYMALKHHAGKDPVEEAGREYWERLGKDAPPPIEPERRIVISGGHASASTEERYMGTLEAGSSNSRVHIPLI